MSLANMSYEELYESYCSSVSEGEEVLTFTEYLEILGVKQ